MTTVATRILLYPAFRCSGVQGRQRTSTSTSRSRSRSTSRIGSFSFSFSFSFSCSCSCSCSSLTPHRAKAHELDLPLRQDLAHGGITQGAQLGFPFVGIAGLKVRVPACG